MSADKSSQYARLWEAAQEWASRESLTPVVEMVLFHGNAGRGAMSLLSANPSQELVPGDTPGQFPPPVGWGSRDIRVSFNGQVREVTGCKRKFIRCLIHFRGAVVPDRTLRLWVWGDLDVSDGRVRDVAHQARQFLRAVTGCGPGDDPVERVEGGYRLGVE